MIDDTADAVFDHEIRVAVQVAARSVIEPPGLADRLIASALHPVRPPAPHRVRLGSTFTRRLLPAMAVAAVVAVVAIVTTTVVSNANSSHRPSVIPPAHSTAPATPGPTSSSGPTAFAPLPVTTPPSVANTGPATTPVPAGFKPYSVSFLDADHGWALGTTGCSAAACAMIARTTDGGASWLRIASPALSMPSTPAGLSGVGLTFADQLDGWAFDGALFSTHDGGANWTRQAAITGSVVGVGAGSGYVEIAVNSCPPGAECVAEGTDSIYRSRIGADSWQRVTGPIELTAADGVPEFVVSGADWWLTVGTRLYHGHGAAAASNLSYPGGAIAVADAQHLDAGTASNPGAGNASGQLWGTTTGGAQWIRTGPTFPVLTDVNGLADNTKGVLIWAESSAASYLLRTTDDGQSFTRVLDANDGGEGWSDLDFVTPTEGVVINGAGRLFMSHDAGATWSPVTF
jgi:hypothetical protein